MKFYKCSHCGNIIMFMENKGVPVMCCGSKMEELIPGSVDASAEKHVPVVFVSQDKVTVTVGEAEHPMIPEHYITWIALETDTGFQVKYLNPGEKPAADFSVSGEGITAVYAYCNIHGLWEKTL